MAFATGGESRYGSIFDPARTQRTASGKAAGP
jgi:hypothetical protein